MKQFKDRALPLLLLVGLQVIVTLPAAAQARSGAITIRYGGLSPFIALLVL